MSSTPDVSKTVSNKFSPFGSAINKTLLTPCRQVGLSRKRKTPSSLVKMLYTSPNISVTESTFSTPVNHKKAADKKSKLAGVSILGKLDESTANPKLSGVGLAKKKLLGDFSEGINIKLEKQIGQKKLMKVDSADLFDEGDEKDYLKELPIDQDEDVKEDNKECLKKLPSDDPPKHDEETKFKILKNATPASQSLRNDTMEGLDEDLKVYSNTQSNLTKSDTNNKRSICSRKNVSVSDENMDKHNEDCLKELSNICVDENNSQIVNNTKTTKLMKKDHVLGSDDDFEVSNQRVDSKPTLKRTASERKNKKSRRVSPVDENLNVEYIKKCPQNYCVQRNSQIINSEAEEIDVLNKDCNSDDDFRVSDKIAKTSTLRKVKSETSKTSRTLDRKTLSHDNFTKCKVTVRKLTEEDIEARSNKDMKNKMEQYTSIEISDDEEVIKRKKCRILSEDDFSKTPTPPTESINVEETTTTVSTITNVLDDEEDAFTSTPEREQSEKIQLINKIKAVDQQVKEKMKKLVDLRQAEVYHSKHNIEDLKALTEVWRKGCVLALNTLLPQLQTHGPINMSTLLNKFHISQEVAELKLKITEQVHKSD